MRTLGRLFLVGLLVVMGTGCPTGGLSGDGQGTQMNGNGGDGSLGGGQAAGEAQAKTAALDSVQAVSRAAAAALPVTTLQAILEGGQSLPSCPEMDLDLGATAMPVTLDYGAGCNPLPFAATVYGGFVDGIVFTAEDSFNLTFDQLTVADESLQGTISGSYFNSGNVVTLISTINVVLAGETTVFGTAELSIDGASGQIEVTTADLSITTSDHVILKAMPQMVVIDGSSNAELLPASGSVVVTVVQDPDDSDYSSYTIIFTEQTPIDGSVDIE